MQLSVLLFYNKQDLPDYGPQMKQFLSSLLTEIENAREPVQSAMAALSADLVVTPRVGAVELDTDALSTALGSVNDDALQTEGVLTLLNNLLTSLTAPTEETAEALNNLGIQMEKLHSPGDALEAMRGAFSATLVPAEKVRATLSMLDSQLSSGAINQKEYSNSLSVLAQQALGVEGALKAQAAAMLAGEKGLAGLLTLVTASTEDFNALADAMDRAGSVDLPTKESAPQPPEQSAPRTAVPQIPDVQAFVGSLSEIIQNSRALLEKSLQNTSVDLILSTKVQDNTVTSEQSNQNGEMATTLVAMLAEYLPYLPQLANMKLVTDTGALVGQLAPKMDERLGVLVTRQRRQ